MSIKRLILLMAVITVSVSFYLLLTLLVPEEDPEKTEEGNVSLIDAYIDNDKVRLEIARTKGDLVRGLSGRGSLGDVDGLLMVFPYVDKHSIWMKDMNFAIDILWIDFSGKVVFIEEDVSPDTYPDLFRPDEPASMVLEVGSGVVKERGWKVGSSIKLSANPSDVEFQN